MGENVTFLASMAKLKAGRLVREVADACLQYWGGMGYTTVRYRQQRGKRQSKTNTGVHCVAFLP